MPEPGALGGRQRRLFNRVKLLHSAGFLPEILTNEDLDHWAAEDSCEEPRVFGQLSQSLWHERELELEEHEAPLEDHEEIWPAELSSG